MMSRTAILGMLVCMACLAGTASAGVNLNVNIGTPPPVVVAQPPDLAVIPGTYVYVAPDVSANMVFYQDNWYRQHGSGWFVSLSYNGPWKAVSAPPAALVHLPQNYGTVPPGHQRMPYGQVKENWRAWERDRHWDRTAKRDDHHGRGRDKHDHKDKKKQHHEDNGNYDRHDDDRGRGRHNHED